MAWIESHQKLKDHPKLLELCSQTKWNIDEAIGKLQRLWWWALDYAEDGDLSRYKPIQFLGHINGSIPCEKLYDILKNTNWIDKNGLIHDWLDYAGKYLYSKYHTSNPKKLKQIYRKYKSILRLSLRTTKGYPKEDHITNHTLPILPNINTIDLVTPILYLNEKAKRSYDPKNDVNQKLVRARYEEGRTLEDFKKVIDRKVAKWLGDPKMRDYLRPSTLFSKTNFENYLNEPDICPKCKGTGKYISSTGYESRCDCTKV